MSDTEPIKFQPRQGLKASIGAPQSVSGIMVVPTTTLVRFDRAELNTILRLYGRMVASGEWRDYAIDLLRDRVVFSIFRRASEVPIYRVEKDPRLARKQGPYSVVAATGLILKRGHELDRVLRVLDKGFYVVGD